ncbi:hypothetical protein CU098_011115 [Rhizopus stolonifer]|uniref:Uncharacterized protein n=2 Tax=Mucorineae TaxID=1344963 RepID=A0A367K685_RHIST|nr:hypothetical protein CU098_011115 [Rhizopus stolonifer]
MDDQNTTTILQKPNEPDEPTYDKPNTYDEYQEPLPQEVIDDLIVRAEFINGKRPDIKTNDQDTSSSCPTISLLSHVPSSTTSLTTTPPPTSISPSTSSISSESSNTSSSTTRQALLQILKKKPMEDMVMYDLRKQSLARPFEHDVYFKGTKIPAYKKIQPHSYSWGFQNILYRLSLDGNIVSDKHKVAEAKRRAFKKEITIEWGDFPLNEKEYTPEEDDELTADTKSGPLYNRTNSHLLFTYDTEFEGFLIRWKRASLLSHDLVCQIRPEKHLEDGNDKKTWRVIAEFDSHRMGYFVHLGQLLIDKNALGLVDRPDQLEAHIIITCSTLIDLMREVVEKAVGLNKGGVVGSD